ncbi:MAG: cadherin-like domain-containing protein [Planctomycetaceae bacterium]
MLEFDDANLESATITIDQFVAGEDLLSFTTQNGISGSWDSVNGVLTLSGTSSVTNYQAALRSVTYTNLSDNPSTVTRTIRYLVNDGTAGSNELTRDVTLTAVNDEQVLSVNTGSTVLENSTGNVIASTSLWTDDLDNSTSQLVYTITADVSWNTAAKWHCVRVGDSWTQADINAGLLSYDHDGSENLTDSVCVHRDMVPVCRPPTLTRWLLRQLTTMIRRLQVTWSEQWHQSPWPKIQRW